MGHSVFDEELARNPHYPPHLGGEVMVPRNNSSLAFSTELLNYIIAFATQGKAGIIKNWMVDLVVSCLQS